MTLALVIVLWAAPLVAAVWLLALAHCRAAAHGDAQAEPPECEVVDFPARLRVVRDGVDAAGETGAVVFDWPSRDEGAA